MRPVDLQDNLSKAPLAGREQSVQQASPDLGQRAAAQELARERALDQTRPTEAPEADNADNRVDDDERGSGDPRHHRQRRDGRAESEADDGAQLHSPSDFSRQIDLTA